MGDEEFFPGGIRDEGIFSLRAAGAEISGGCRMNPIFGGKHNTLCFTNGVQNTFFRTECGVR